MVGVIVKCVGYDYRMMIYNGLKNWIEGVCLLLVIVDISGFV